MATPETPFTTTFELSASFDDAVANLRTALADQGFGIMTEIDISATLKKKLNADYPKTLLLGACNPSLALRALIAEPDVGVLLPCNIIVRMRGDDVVEVSALNPLFSLAHLLSQPEIDAVAREANQRINAALDVVKAR